MRFPARPQLLMLVFLISLMVSVGITAAELPGSNQPIKQRWVEAWKAQSNPQSRYLNRLVLSESAYLRQHADNPIDWYPWREGALKRAVRENKLIFLSIGYASCHWCHVMEKESFNHKDVAEILNRNYVSVKVDREQQPVIDAYFFLAVEVLKGESGWPITVVLLPDGRPVFATNYISKESLITALGRLHQLWTEQPAVMTENARLLTAEIERHNLPLVDNPIINRKATAEKARENLLASMDTVYGGFGTGPKFPDELKLQFLLNQFKVNPSPALKASLIQQLDIIMNSGLNDSIFAGVFRYTTDRQMTRPHFEKMLYNQALTTSLFIDAADWLEKPDYKNYANTIISFVESTLKLADGTYAAAVDADYNGREGAYYLWTGAQLKGLPAETKTTVFDEGLKFIYAGIPTDWKNKLIQHRSGTPRVIENRVTAWNALWLSALVDADEIGKALQLANAIWGSAWVKGQLYRLDSQPAYLDDYSYLARAYWQLYIKTTDTNWKTKARLLDRAILDKFYQDGKLSYQQRARNMSNMSFSLDIYQDRELPSPAAVVLSLFRNHQTEPGFAEAYTAISKSAYAQIGSNPEFYLSLNLATETDYPTVDKMIANGHAIASLVSMPGHIPGEARWELTISLDPDWHINAAEVFDKNLVPTKIQPNKLISHVAYPQGEDLAANFTDNKLNVYSNRVSISIFTPTNPDALSIAIKLQACSSDLCLLPETVVLKAHRTN